MLLERLTPIREQQAEDRKIRTSTGRRQARTAMEFEDAGDDD